MQENGRGDYIKVTYPGKSHTAYSVRQHVPQDGRERVTGREVGVEMRVLPMGHLQYDRVHDNTDYINEMFFERCYIHDHKEPKGQRS